VLIVFILTFIFVNILKSNNKLKNILEIMDFSKFALNKILQDILIINDVPF